MTLSITRPTGWTGLGSGGGGGGGVTSVDGRTGVVTLADIYVDVTGDTMTGDLRAPNVGINAAPGGNNRLNVAQTATHTTGTGPVAVRVANDWSAGADANATVVGMQIAFSATQNAGTYTGPAFESLAALNVAASIGGAGNLNLGSAGGTGIAVALTKTGAGTLQQLTGLYIAPPTVSAGTVTRGYGVYVAAQKPGTGSGYGIYQTSANDQNYFNGNVGLGTISPTLARLQFTAATNAAGGIMFGTDTSLYRSAADTLKTDDVFVAATALAIGATPAASGTVRLTDTSLFNVAAGQSFSFGTGGGAKITINDAGLTIADGMNIATGAITGTRVAASTTQKLAFYGATPIVQPTVAVAATDAATTQALANSLRTALLALGLAA